MQKARWMLLIVGFIAVASVVGILGRQEFSFLPAFLSGIEKNAVVEEKELSRKEFTSLQDRMEHVFESLKIQLVDPPVPLVDFTLKNLSGEEVRTQDLREKFLWLSFWTTGCPPCRAEMPSMQRLWEGFGGEDFALLAVNLREDEKAVRRFVDDNAYSFPVLLDLSGKVSNSYGIRSIPTNFFVNPVGEIVGVAIGAREWESKNFYNFLQELADSRNE